MIKIKKFIFLIYFFFISDLYAFSNSKIIIKVENEIITNIDLKNKIISSLVMANKEINQNSIDSLKRSSVETLINQKIKLMEVSKYNIEDDKLQLKNYLNSISNGNIDNLQKKFIQNNLDFNSFSEEINTQLKWQKLIYRIYSKKIEIDYNSIDRDINEIIEENLSIDEFNLSEIEVNRNNDISDNEIILDLQKLIIKQGFENVALENSISLSSNQKGNLGWINSKSLSEQIYNKVNNLDIGEISEPIIRSDSITFLKLNNKRSVKNNQINIEELRDKLTNQKKNYLFNLFSASHLSKLKNKTFIEYIK